MGEVKKVQTKKETAGFRPAALFFPFQRSTVPGKKICALSQVARESGKKSGDTRHPCPVRLFVFTFKLFKRQAASTVFYGHLICPSV